MNTRTVARALNLKYETLDYWERSGLLQIAQPGGEWTERRWSLGDATRASAVHWLRSLGVSLQQIRASGIIDRVTDNAISDGKLVVYDVPSATMSVMDRQELADLETYTLTGHQRLTFALGAALEQWKRIARA